MSHPYPHSFKHGDHLIICDICGRQVYRSQALYRWDGLLCCTVYNCWDRKHEIFEPLPVINDPAVIQDIRPDTIAGQETFVSDDNLVGLSSFFGMLTTNPAAPDGHIYLGQTRVFIGQVDAPPNYAGL